jgi:hypothetical protein
MGEFSRTGLVENKDGIKEVVSSKSHCKIINLPPLDEKLAEFVGIVLGDVNIFSKVYPNTVINHVRVVGNPKTERWYLLNFIKPLIESLFDIMVGVIRTRRAMKFF